MREPGLQFGNALGRWPRKRSVTAGSPGKCGPDEPLRQEFPVRVAGVEGDDVVGSAAHSSRVKEARCLGRSECSCLPAVIGRSGGAVCPDESAHAGAAFYQALGSEGSQGLLHGDRACLVLGHELTGGWQLGSRRGPCDPFL